MCHKSKKIEEKGKAEEVFMNGLNNLSYNCDMCCIVICSECVDMAITRIIECNNTRIRRRKI